MKKTQFCSIYALVICAIMASAVPTAADAQAVKFRRPLDIVLNPPVTAYFDNNLAAGAWRTYWWETGVVDGVSYDSHKGTDFKTNNGTSSTWPVYAGAQGTPYYSVTDCPTTGSSGCGGGFGNHVRMDHNSSGIDGVGMVSIYAHLAKDTAIASTTAPIYCGSYIGQTGASGVGTGPHLHFELRPSGFDTTSRIDPFAGYGSHPESYWYATTTALGAYSGGIPTTQCQPLPLWSTNLSVDVVSANALRINFKDNAFDEYATHVERKVGASGTWTPYVYFGALTGTQSWMWTDTSGISAGQTYCYRLRTQNSYGYSMYSNESCGTTQNGVNLLRAPNNVLISNPTASSLRVNFTDNADNETNILVERKKTPVGAWSSLIGFGALSGTANWYWDNTGLTQKTTYCYRLKAVNALGSSAYSNEACGTTQ